MSKSAIYILLIFVLFSCKKNPLIQNPTVNHLLEISFSTPLQKGTKSSSDILFNTSFSLGDEIGVFAVERNDPGIQSYPQPSGNYANNIKLVYQSNGTWAYSDPNQTIYYRQAGVPIDLYAYYPYAPDIDPTDLSFNVSADQSSTGFFSSDLLTSSALNQTSTSVTLTFSHIMSLIQVKVNSGGEGANITANTAVQLMAVNYGLSLNIGTTTQTTGSTSGNITMWRVEQPGDADYMNSYTYRAVVPSQTLIQGSMLFAFARNGRSLGYFIQSSTTLTSGQVSLFDVTLDASLSPSHKYKIGDIYPYKGFPSGVVFSITDGGLSGSILSLNELAPSAWSNQVLQTNASDENNGTNNMNIISAIPDWQTNYPAFFNASTQGTAWYLPSINELTSIYPQISVINTTINKFAGNPVLSTIYWSSTEADDSNAKVASMSDGLAGVVTKNTSCNIRPIKTF